MIIQYQKTYDWCNFKLVIGFGKNKIVFGADMSSSVHADNKKKILIFDESPTERLDDTALIEEKIYLANFTESKIFLKLAL